MKKYLFMITDIVFFFCFFLSQFFQQQQERFSVSLFEVVITTVLYAAVSLNKIMFSVEVFA